MARIVASTQSETSCPLSMSIRSPILTGSNGSPWVTRPRVGGYTTMSAWARSPTLPPPSYHFEFPASSGGVSVPDGTLETARSSSAIP